MAILFTQYWDVIPGKFDEYSAFITHEYNPTLERLGINLVGGLLRGGGGRARIVAVATVDEQDYLRKILATEEYRMSQQTAMTWSGNITASFGSPPAGSSKDPTGSKRGSGNSTSTTICSGEGGRALSLCQGRVSPGNGRTEGPDYRRLAAGHRQRPRNLAECTGAKHCRHCQGHRHLRVQKTGPDPKNNYATDYSSRILAPTGRIEVPYLMSEMMKSF